MVVRIALPTPRFEDEDEVITASFREEEYRKKILVVVYSLNTGSWKLVQTQSLLKWPCALCNNRCTCYMELYWLLICSIDEVFREILPNNMIRFGLQLGDNEMVACIFRGSLGLLRYYDRSGSWDRCCSIMADETVRCG
jgi:hypothetical protein